MDEVTIRIAAPSEDLWRMVSDITRMGEWSPENRGGRWLGKAKGPTVGARFVGFNRHGIVPWATRCEVTKADPPRHFEFRVKESGMRWGYRFEPDGDGTTVTEYREHLRPLPGWVKAVYRTRLLGRDRQTLLVDGMHQTLERLKAAAEAGR
ncbi:MAG: SRPBCC family protein [Acidimicrobiales bacterium]